ncbi:MAG: TrkA family potassium uptake protein [Hadesarchaea archaeon]|nr:TrkA family potassium uptake protein [Hadesarchaea archaeon]
MYIIVAGAGLVGRRVTKELVDRGHDVIVIDIDRDACEKVSMETGAKVIQGDASEVDILRKAGVERADVCIGLIGKDSANLAFTILSNAYEVPNILVRMRDPSYKIAYSVAGAKRALNTAEIYMDSILLEIEHPSMKKVLNMGSGEASIVVVEIPEDSPVKEKRIAEIIMQEEFPESCIFAGIYREEEFIIPRGNEEIKANDRVFLSGKSESIRQAAVALGVK